MSLESNIPKNLSQMLQAMATDFPAILGGNLVGIYLWGSLTYDAFYEGCSDVDCIVVTARDRNDSSRRTISQSTLGSRAVRCSK